jgi:hypothetical protein
MATLCCQKSCVLVDADVDPDASSSTKSLALNGDEAFRRFFLEVEE